MMKIGIVPLNSEISGENAKEQFLGKLKERGIETEEKERANPEEIVFFAVITGGSEQKFKRIYDKFSPPYLILYDAFNNSLPAAMEILSFLNKQGLKGELIDVNNLSEKLIEEKFPLHGKTLGLIGEPSDWLIASTYPDEIYKSTFKINVVHVPLEEVFAIFRKTNDSKAKPVAEEIMKRASGIYGINEEAMIRAVKFYTALKEIIEKYALNYITVRCFDIIEPLNTTGCIALSELNGEGIVAGCEGDVPAALSMAFLKKVSSRPAFMANVSYIRENTENLTVNFAHCTIPTVITEKFSLRTHFESGKGVGIEGKLKEGDVTILRIGGKEMKKAVIMSGKAVETPFSAMRCRSQLNVETSKNAKDYFLKTPLGNHHVIAKGNYVKILGEMLGKMGMETKEF